jgi:hypothetical protein
VGFADPFVQNPNTTYDSLHPNEGLYLQDANPFDIGSGCELDGMPTDCSRLAHSLENGTVGVQIGAGGKIFGVNNFQPGFGGIWVSQPTPSDPAYEDDLPPLHLKVTDNAYKDVWVSFGSAQNTGDLPIGHLTFATALVVQKLTPDLLTSNQDVLRDLYCLWKTGGYGVRDTERSLWITGNGGKYGSVPWPWSAESKKETWNGPLPVGTVANAHTHPDRSISESKASPKPSTTGGNTGRGDQGTADKIGLPVYVVTGQAIWKAVPKAKDPVQVAGSDWWKPFDKAKVKCP